MPSIIFYDVLMDLSQKIRELQLLEVEEKITKLAAKMAVPMIILIMLPLLAMVAGLGFIQQLGAESTEIYYLSINPTNNEARVKYWAEHCVGEDNALFAEDYQNMLLAFQKIISIETGFHINDTE